MDSGFVQMKADDIGNEVGTMGVFDCVEERLLIYARMVYHGYGLWVWYFSENGDLYYTNCPYEKELQTFFYLGKCLDYAVAQRDASETPFLMSDSVGLVWLGEYIPHPGMERRFLVVGPAFQERFSEFGINNELWNLNISRELQREYLNLLRKMPVVSLQQFNSLAKSLHYTISFSDIQDVEIKLQTPNRQKDGVWELKPTDYEQENHRERMLLQFVRDGNSGYGNVLDIFTRSGRGRFFGQESIRVVKNTVLIFISKCASAAIEGGLPVKTAKEMEMDFLRRVENQRTTTGLVSLCGEAMDTFVKQVAQHKNYTEMSQPVSLCCDYIKKHISEPLTLKELAELTGYTEYYLARKFQKETGVRLLDYIRQTRLDYARILLSTTNLSVQQISEKLQFGTRNYFTKKFREYVGVSPMEYRKRAQGGIV